MADAGQGDEGRAGADGAERIPVRGWIASAVVVLIGLVLLLTEWRTEEHQLPVSLGRMRLTQVVRGADAQSMVDRMHGKGVAPKENLVGSYGSGDSTATVFVSYYDDARIPVLQMERMADLIRYRTFEFSGLTRGTVEGVDVCECRTMGLPQAFFALDRGLYWMSASEASGPDALRHLVRALKR
jgi:hypothetical protein